MKRSTTISALAAATVALALAGNASAQEIPRPNYTFVELDYVYATADVESEALSDQANADTFYIPQGLALKGSAVLVEQLLLRASYYAGKGEWKKTADVEVTSGVVSVGWLAPTTDSTGIDVSLEYRGDDIEFKKSSTGRKEDGDIKGAGISFGVRAAPAKWLEIGARAGWYEGDWDGAIGFQLNGAWNIGDHWGVNLSWDRIDADLKSGEKYELNQYALGGRFYF